MGKRRQGEREKWSIGGMENQEREKRIHKKREKQEWEKKVRERKTGREKNGSYGRTKITSM